MVEGSDETWFEIKVRGVLGHEKKVDKAAIILGRRIKIEGELFTCGADPKHREKILEHFDMGTGTRPLTTNGEREEKETETEGESPELNKGDATIYRGLAARLNFLTQDCPDL